MVNPLEELTGVADVGAQVEQLLREVDGLKRDVKTLKSQGLGGVIRKRPDGTLIIGITPITIEEDGIHFKAPSFGDGVIFDAEAAVASLKGSSAATLSYMQLLAAGADGDTQDYAYLQVRGADNDSQVLMRLEGNGVEIGNAQLTKVSFSVGTVPLQLQTVSSDPGTLQDGMIWFRGDLDEIRVRLDGVTKTLPGGAMKTASGGYFLIPAGPSVGTSLTSDGNADTYGPWTEMIASTSAAIYIVGVAIRNIDLNNATYIVLDIGTGAALSESSVGEWPFHWTRDASAAAAGHSVTLPYAIPVATSTRITCRVADAEAATNTHSVNLICINQADITAI